MVGCAEEVARAIDIKTCEIGGWYANANGDPYGIRSLLGEEDHLEKGYVDEFIFVRSPDSNGGCVRGSTVDKGHALYDRIRREAEKRDLDEAFGLIKPLLEANPNWKYRDALEHLHASGVKRPRNPYLQIEYLNRKTDEAERLEAMTVAGRIPA